ncbi:MAG: GNAT family N-acetyltransferase, partial [Bacteroidia bacterium]|nr:GNAT family N-acetyltransferase [Bacteroidia bacterium]
MQLRIRTYQSKDYPFLVEMFYQSLYVPEGKDPYDRGVIQKPELARYFIEWGRPTDHCFIAEKDGKRIGAVWARFFTEEDPGYGFVEERFPELGIALLPDYRGKGVGSDLLDHLIQFLKTENIPGVSLSVD